jgi:hypothetical protein
LALRVPARCFGSRSPLELPNIVLVAVSMQCDNLLRAQLENARLIGASMQNDN